jgi:hypothetical protein
MMSFVTSGSPSKSSESIAKCKRYEDATRKQVAIFSFSQFESKRVFICCKSWQIRFSRRLKPIQRFSIVRRSFSR